MEYFIVYRADGLVGCIEASSYQDAKSQLSKDDILGEQVCEKEAEATWHAIRQQLKAG